MKYFLIDPPSVKHHHHRFAKTHFTEVNYTLSFQSAGSIDRTIDYGLKLFSGEKEEDVFMKFTLVILSSEPTKVPPLLSELVGTVISCPDK